LVAVIEGIKPQLEVYVQQIETQHKQIDRLELRVKELESQLHQNSRNSS
jgi:cell division protein FtsB